MMSGLMASAYAGLIGSAMMIVGFQMLNLGLYSRIYAIHSGFETDDRIIDIIAENIAFERGVLFAACLIFAALAGLFLNPGMIAHKLFIFTVFLMGIQAFFSAFFISMMLVEKI
jgi:hypothetical protein